MARIAPIDPATATGRAKEIFDGPLKGKTFNIFKSMAASPAALDAYLGMSGALARGVLTPAEREVIHLALGQARECDYCVAAHTAIGKGAGMSEAQTIEARRGEMKDPRLNAMARFVSRLEEKRGFVSEADLGEFRKAGYTDAHLAETIAHFGLATYTNYFNHANETPLDFPAAPAI